MVQANRIAEAKRFLRHALEIFDRFKTETGYEHPYANAARATLVTIQSKMSGCGIFVLSAISGSLIRLWAMDGKFTVGELTAVRQSESTVYLSPCLGSTKEGRLWAYLNPLSAARCHRWHAVRTVGDWPKIIREDIPPRKCC